MLNHFKKEFQRIEYEKRNGKGKLPSVYKRCLCESLLHIELTSNWREAITFTKKEAEQLAYVLCMEYSKFSW